MKIAGENGEFGRDQNEQPLSNAQKARYFFFQPVWKKATVIVAGVVVNFIIGWLLLSVVLMIGTPQVVFVSSVAPNSPAEAAHIKAGDAITGFRSTQELIQFINSHRGEEITLTLSRGGEAMTVNLTPRINPAPNEGAVGVALGDAGSAPMPFFEALSEGLDQAFIIVWLTITGFFGLISSLFQAHVPADVVGPVGIFSVAQQTGKIGLIYLIRLLSFISINLAVINILPFPALDGGRLFLIFLEKIKGSPLSQRTEALINGTGFVFLILLMIVISIHDITR